MLLSQQRITTVTAKNHHSFLKPKAPFGPVSFLISSPGNPSIENHNPCIFSINQTLQTHTQQTQTHFSQKSGLLCYFHRNQTKQFVWFLWKKHSKPMLCFSTRCDFPSLLLICVSCVLCISCALLAQGTGEGEWKKPRGNSGNQPRGRGNRGNRRPRGRGRGNMEQGTGEWERGIDREGGRMGEGNGINLIKEALKELIWYEVRGRKLWRN